MVGICEGPFLEFFCRSYKTEFRNSWFFKVFVVINI